MPQLMPREVTCANGLFLPSRQLFTVAGRAGDMLHIARLLTASTISGASLAIAAPMPALGAAAASAAPITLPSFIAMVSTSQGNPDSATSWELYFDVNLLHR